MDPAFSPIPAPASDGAAPDPAAAYEPPAIGAHSSVPASLIGVVTQGSDPGAQVVSPAWSGLRPKG
ncbi:MAG: hypothetical protein WCI50_01760 [Actinomycetes bacterium]